MHRETVFEYVEGERDRLRDLARDIWEHPELGLREERSSERLREVLEAAGFEVEAGVAGMPTAFVARYGDASPTIGLLGEFDALPGLSQRATTERDPIEEGGPGHGCGHNLLGVGSLGAALAVKRAIDDGLVEGSVAYFGCPSEEDLVGKVFMARAGAFDDLDAALDWHPGQATAPLLASSLAVNSITYTFHGTAAHGAASPESGRSALDAVQLMNTGVEYMREHVPDGARINYSIVETNPAPNVVPDEATVWYYARAPEKPQLDRIREWMEDIARGAATMTQTDVEVDSLTGCYDLLTNETISDVLYENMAAAGPIDYTEEERATARDLQATVDEVTPWLDCLPEEATEHDLYTDVLEPVGGGTHFSGGTDVGDVSWVTPLGRFNATTWPVGVAAHTWQATAANGSFALRVPAFVAKVLAATACDLAADAETLEAARDEFERATAERSYRNQLPDGAEPPFRVRDLTE